MDTREKVIREIFNDVYPVSDKSLDLIFQMVEYKSIPKGKVFIQHKRPDTYEYFLLDGVCRSYLLDPEGEEITINFYQGPGVLTPHVIRTSKEVSLFNYQAATDLEVAYFGEQIFLELMISNLEIRFFANTVLRSELIQKVNKEIGLASLTAKERLTRFRQTFAGLENILPHPMIASYLGITNISLSRLRGELADG